jgi:MYXO-CTERM domain-containing protein
MHVLPRLAGVAVAATLALGASIPASAAGLEGIPAYDHVGVLVLENESFTSTWGATSPATYLNSLVPGGAFADMYFGTGHVSLDNYIAMTSGQGWTPTTGSDCASQNLFQCAAVTSAPAGGINIADQVETAGKTWAGYMDGTTTACLHADPSSTATPPDPYQGNGALSTNYADRHNPFIYYNDILTNATRCTQHVLPYAQLATDISGNTLPNFFFITPDTCHDGHDTPCAGGSAVPPCAPRNAAAGGLVSADCWLQANLASLVTYLNAHNGVLFITFDEGANSDTTGCCTGGVGGAAGFGGRVGLLALGPGVAVGTTTHHNYDHASMLRTFEDALGITTYIGNASSATAMSDLFATPSTNAPETPLVVALPLAAVGALLLWRRRKPRT